jgi:hypothetical protein
VKRSFFLHEPLSLAFTANYIMTIQKSKYRIMYVGSIDLFYELSAR